MAETKKILTLPILEYYDEKSVERMESADAAVLQAAKEHAEGLSVNYDAAGTAQTKVNELANGQVKTNKENIEKLNGDASTEGSVAKAVKDAQDALQDNIDVVDGKADKNAEDIVALQGRMTIAEGDIDAVETDMGDVDNLSTTNKTIVGAINEVLTAVGTGGTASVVTVTTDVTSEGALKSYTIKQGEATVGVIDIPKDMVVESGEVVVDPEGQTAGTYIKLVLANVAEPLFINVGTLVDIYKAKEGASQVQIAIDPMTREISASIVAGSIGSAELAVNAVITEKIADANVTKAKLSTSLQTSIDKADAAAPQTALDEEVARAKEAEAKALTDANAHADAQVAAEKSRAEGIEAGHEARIAEIEAQLGDGEGSVAEQIAAAKQEAIEAAAADATTKANAVDEKLTAEANRAKAAEAQALADAKAHTDAEIAKIDLSGIQDNADAISELEGRMEAEEEKSADFEARIAAIESVEYVEITTTEIDNMIARQ